MIDITEKLKNYEHIFFNHYKVFTQAGFVSAVHHFVKKEDYSRGEIKEMIRNFPTKYPCEIYIDEDIFNQGKIFIHSPDGEVKYK